MKPKVALTLAPLLAVLLLTGVILAADGYDLSWNVLGGGGGHTEATPYIVDSSIGQGVAAVVASAPYELCSGYWCGAGTPVPTPVPTITPTGTPIAMPDLIITDIWNEGAVIWAQMRNVGRVGVPPEHRTNLRVDGTLRTETALAGIAPGERITYSFSTYTWTCSAPGDLIRVCADAAGFVVESDESNNCREETWSCDSIPPRFLYGPTAYGITTTSANVCWETDEPNQGTLRYGRHAGGYEGEAQATGLAVQHCLTLNSLAPATTYHFMVEATDASQNLAASKERNFQTLPAADSEKPSAQLLLPAKLSGVVPITATAADNTGIEKVVFYVNDQAAYTDFSTPFTWSFDTTTLGDGGHIFKARAVDAAGNTADTLQSAEVRNHFPLDLSPVHVTIPAFRSRDEVWGTVAIGAEVTHDNGEPIGRVEFSVDGVVVHAVDYYCLRLPYPGGELCHGVPPVQETWFWAASGLPEGSEHVIEVQAWDNLTPANSNRARVTVKIVRPEPVLSVARDVVRTGNYFSVTLTLRNAGLVDITDLRIEDTSMGYQAAGHVHISRTPSDPFGSAEPCQAVSGPLGELSSVGYLFAGTLSAGSTWRVTYESIPVTFLPRLPVEGFEHAIGSLLWLQYASGGRAYSRSYRDLSYVSSGAMSEALGTADYLIVTNPPRLFAGNEAADVAALLSSMAELARERNGVLAYIPYAQLLDEWEIYDRISAPWWLKNQLVHLRGPRHSPEMSAWRAHGYLLLVGETEILPAYELSFCGRIEPSGYYPAACGADHRRATIQTFLSDQPYSDLEGSDGKPELRVGRIIGNTAAELAAPIRAALSGEFDRSHAIIVTGPETWTEGGWFISHANRLASSLRDRLEVAPPVHTEYYSTEADLLREALLILGTRWDLDPAGPKPDLPPELNDLALLVGWYDGVSRLPPDELSQLRALITQGEAERVWAAARGVPGAYVTSFSNNCEVMAARAAQIKTLAVDKDIILWNGHGGPGSWANCLDAFVGTCGSTDLYTDYPPHPLQFGSSAPVVVAASCLTGNYEMDDAHGIAETFLRRGAGAYIGATRSLSGNTAMEFQRRFMEVAWTPEQTLGDALAALETELIEVDDTDPYSGGFEEWLRAAHIFNLYGDPKFGRTASAETTSASMTQPAAGTQGSVPPSPLRVAVPRYQVTTLAGFDYVDIPGGHILLVDGQPRVPYYAVSLEYPAGYRVRDVILRERAGLVTAAGLNLPSVDMSEIASTGRRPSSIDDQVWYPQADYRWQVWENANGTTTLVIVLHPFFYNSLTTGVRFYQDYTFDIEYVASTTTITELTADQDIYEPGEAVSVNIGLANSGGAQDVIVDAQVKRYGSGETVDGLLLQTLHALSGSASLTAQWDSASSEAGDYVVQVTLKDAGGNVLDEATVDFRLGLIAGEIARLTATPQRFKRGDDIAITLEVGNTGTAELSGTAMVRIRDEHGAMIQQYQHSFSDLMPAKTLVFQDTWNTSGAGEETYAIVAYVAYNSTSSAPRTIMVSTRVRTYLPSILRN